MPNSALGGSFSTASLPTSTGTCPVQGFLYCFTTGSSLKKARGEQVSGSHQNLAGFHIWPGDSHPLSCWMNSKCSQGISQFTAGRCRNYRSSLFELVTMGICAHKNEGTLESTLAKSSSYLTADRKTPMSFYPLLVHMDAHRPKKSYHRGSKFIGK